MKVNMLRIAALLLVSVVLFSACRRKKEELTPNDGTTTESNDAQNQWDNALKISEEAMDQEGEFDASARTAAFGLLGCAQSVVKETIAEGNFTGKITVDYGSSMTNACNDAKLRRGRIIIKYTGRYRDDNTVIQITTDNYYVNNIKIEGRRTVTNTGNHVYSVVDAGLDGTGYSRFITLDNKITTWKSTRTRRWTEGISTPGILTDDVYVINGTGEGVSSAGDAYTLTAVNLGVKLLCYSAYIFMPSSGIVTITSPNGTRTIDYGSGECDRNVVYTHTNGKTYNISL